jgi:membrane protein
VNGDSVRYQRAAKLRHGAAVGGASVGVRDARREELDRPKCSDRSRLATAIAPHHAALASGGGDRLLHQWVVGTPSRWHALRSRRSVIVRSVDWQFDWKDCCRSLWREVNDDQIANGAAALAFYMVLSLFPCAIFSLSVLPYLPIANLQQAMLDLVHEALPDNAGELLTSTVQSVVSRRGYGVLSFAFLFTLWSATSGLHGLMQQLNAVYEVKEERSFLWARGVALLLTAAFFGLVVGAFVLIIFGGIIQSYIGNHLGWSQGLLWLFAGLRYLIIVSALHLAFSLIYYLGPNLRQPFVLITPGSLVATLFLLGISMAFKLYVNRFSDYDALYGSLGAVIVLMLWLFAAGWVILFGGELNDVLRRDRSSGGHL